MPAFEAIGGMPYWIDLSSSDPRKSSYFYSKLLGWEITQERDDSAYRIARKDGLPVAGIIPQSGAMPDTWVTYFLADDIEADRAKAETSGGRALGDPAEVQLGTMAVLADATGGLFGLIEPAGEDSFVAAGEPGTAVWHELTATTDFTGAIDFYNALFDWEIVALGDDDYGYATAMQDGAAFAGLRDAHGHFPPQVPSFWQSFLGVADVDYAARRAAELGGEVIREPFDSEFGRLTIIADSTGATVTLCEVEEPVDEAQLRESDDILGL